jgi:hypothetical protein
MTDRARFIVWAHRSAESIFGAASNPVIRNGTLLSFDSEGRALAECDRLNVHSAGSYVRYSIKQAHDRSVAAA